MTFEETLAEWIPTQRWFAGKGARILDVAIVADTALASGDPGLRHLMVDVHQDAGVDSYQILIGQRAELPDHLTHVLIGVAEDGRLAYDALHDPELTRLLLDAIAGNGRAGPLSFYAEPGAELDTDLDSLVLTGEQSNTSLMFGEASILKVFRRPGPRAQPRPGGPPGAGPARIPAHRGAARLVRGQARRRAHHPRHPVGLPAGGHRRLVAGRDQRARPVRGR